MRKNYCKSGIIIVKNKRENNNACGWSPFQGWSRSIFPSSPEVKNSIYIVTNMLTIIRGSIDNEMTTPKSFHDAQITTDNLAGFIVSCKSLHSLNIVPH